MQNGPDASKHHIAQVSWRERKAVRRLIIFGVPLLAGLAAAVLWFSNPLAGRGPMPCLLYQFSGLYCPGCGTTRALHALMHLRWREAVSHNIFMIIWLPLPVWAVFGEWIRAVSGRRIVSPPADHRWILWALLISCVLFFAARNLPWPLFTWLAP